MVATVRERGNPWTSGRGRPVRFPAFADTSEVRHAGSSCGGMTTAFLRWTCLRAAFSRGYWLTTALYLVVVADLTPFQLVLIGTFQGITVVIAEVPAGVLADAVSR